MTDIQLYIDNKVATLLLDPADNKPAALDLDVLQKLNYCMEEIEIQQPDVVLVKSTSERFFCVGANINALKDINEDTIENWVKEGHKVFNRLEDLPMPVIAVVNGYAMGGGLELAMACDLIFASENAKLAQSEAGLGFIPGWGGTHRLPQRLGTSKAKYYFYSGKMLTATEAALVGLVDFCGTQAELEVEAQNFVQSIQSSNSNAIRQFKTILNDQQRAARNENTDIEASRSISCLQDSDTKQRLHDFLNKKGKK
ncbi:MAG: enoyl-CoA hydratase/isomerase family protein [Lentisphaerales bacterium]|nr:enoyl-CoA hydratase/isomerase family protein [Lentisphaerales bacterium]